MQRGPDQSYIATAIAVGAIRAGRRALVRSTFKRIGWSRFCCRLIKRVKDEGEEPFLISFPI
jgi:hypothetical protein